jgi:hypothetical protein
VQDVLRDPVLELRGPDGSLIFRNDNWKRSPQRSRTAGSPFKPTDDAEAVIFARLNPGAYTALLTGKNQTTGIGLIEVYDIGKKADSELANISTRGFVEQGEGLTCGGFILGGGKGEAQIALRGLGPSLRERGIDAPLANPTLKLHDANGTVMSANDNWMDNPRSAARLTALGLAPEDRRESGIVVSLRAGAYTVHLTGKRDGSGIGLIEIYNLQ